MTDKTITIEFDVISTATTRQILFEAQKGYSYEYPPQRITVIRDVVKAIDEKIEEVVDD